MQTETIETNNIKLHVLTDGPENGTSVVLLHGFPEFHYGWRKQVPALVQAGFRVIVPDQRGYNLSDKPRSVSAYDVDILAKDIVGLLDHFGIKQA
ncbi:MAG: alpha/beta fold hydrolase, partial [Anaerolineales bacterium]|nr:alpha/beta fold hydrolase [Anaerolineales bacterium]